MKKDEKVCAVVVTYNRKELLIECIESLFNQTRSVDGIYIIDNASDDNTPELLKEKGIIQELPPEKLFKPWEKEFQKNGIPIYYVRMNENTGGAGGFYEGVKRAYERGYDWLWLMDDDTEPFNSALEKMLEKKKYISGKIGFFCSKVLWKDNKPHIMNVPSILPLINNIPFNIYDDKKILLVKTASFVSLLVSKEAVIEAGLPIKEFFIWGDDVEFTLRITNKGFQNFYVCDSLALHKTKKNYSADEVYDWRYFFNIRNNLWILKLYNKKKYFLILIKYILLLFKQPVKLWGTYIKALLSSLFFTPRIEYFKDNQ